MFIKFTSSASSATKRKFLSAGSLSVVMLVGLAFWLSFSMKFGKVKKTYYKSGELLAEAHYRQGRPWGITRLYYKSGVVRSEANFRKGKLDGLSKLYYESGALGAEIQFKNGKQHGTARFYNEDGTLKLVEIFDNGEPVDRQLQQTQQAFP